MYFSTDLNSTFANRTVYTRKQIREMLKSKSQSTLFEWLDSNEFAKPYFDIDKDYEEEQDLTELQQKTDETAAQAVQVPAQDHQYCVCVRCCKAHQPFPGPRFHRG